MSFLILIIQNPHYIIITLAMGHSHIHLMVVFLKVYIHSKVKELEKLKMISLKH